MKIAQFLLAFALGALATTAPAQYALDWYKFAGGGGTSTGGAYSVSGTVGQPDASGPLTGGSYSLTGGYSITTANGTNSVTITPPVGNLFFRLEE